MFVRQMKHLKVAITIVVGATVLLINSANKAMAGEWKYSHKLENSTCGSYCGIMQHQKEVYIASNVVSEKLKNKGVGEIWLQKSGGLQKSFTRAKNVINAKDLAIYVDEQGTPMDFVRTIGLASDGKMCHMLTHVGPFYNPTSGTLRPAYASSDDCKNWVYRGPVLINGKARPIFSSSMAYIVHEGMHYMAQDAGAYGYGSLTIFASSDGVNYSPVSEKINHFLGEDWPVWPDLAYCQDQYHLVYEDGWGNGTNRVRHLISDDLVNWKLEADAIANNSYKGLNIACIDGELVGVSEQEVWLWSKSRTASNSLSKRSSSAPLVRPSSN